MIQGNFVGRYCQLCIIWSFIDFLVLAMYMARQCKGRGPCRRSLQLIWVNRGKHSQLCIALSFLLPASTPWFLLTFQHSLKVIALYFGIYFPHVNAAFSSLVLLKHVAMPHISRRSKHLCYLWLALIFICFFLLYFGIIMYHFYEAV